MLTKPPNFELCPQIKSPKYACPGEKTAEIEILLRHSGHLWNSFLDEPLKLKKLPAFLQQRLNVFEKMLVCGWSMLNYVEGQDWWSFRERKKSEKVGRWWYSMDNEWEGAAKCSAPFGWEVAHPPKRRSHGKCKEKVVYVSLFLLLFGYLTIVLPA